MYQLSVSIETKTLSSQNIYHTILCFLAVGLVVAMYDCFAVVVVFSCMDYIWYGSVMLWEFLTNNNAGKVVLYRLPLLCWGIGNFLCESTIDLTQWCLKLFEWKNIKYYTVFLFCAELFVSVLGVFRLLLPVFCGLSYEKWKIKESQTSN